MQALAQPGRPERLSPAWRRALPVLILLVVVIGVLYRQTMMVMIEIWWRSETFNHCILILPISLWLIWGKRHELALLTPAPSPWVLVASIVAGAAWLAGELAAVNSINQLAMLSLMLLAVPTILGIRVAMTIAFPLGFMYFAVPIGEFVMPKMMEWTADFTVFAVALSGVPVFREGQNFVIPSGSWSVVEACSGVRYLIASTTVGTLFAYLNYRSMTRRWLFVGFAILVPILANWLRAYMIVMLGHLSNNRIAVGVDHLLYGWVFFGVVIAIMFMVGARWSEAPQPQVPAQKVTAGAAGAPWPSWPVGVAAAALAALPVFLNAAIVRGEAADRSQLVLPADVEGWTRSLDIPIDWRPAFSGTTTSTFLHFRNGELSAGLYVGQYRNQTFERKLVSSDNALVKTTDPVWAQIKAGLRDAEFAAKPVQARTAELRSGRGDMDGARWQVQWFYWIDGSLTSDDYRAKMLTTWARLNGRGDNSAAIIYFAPADQPAGADTAIAALMRASGTQVDAALRAASAGR